ncbi:hypothetical protein F5Y17DRAFT_474180 [Xylariaceae sp. FL0594]|nr:hypothetical protein F5Y17DRAFT_474180 [Xylariaceae sp. FL0594]
MQSIVGLAGCLHAIDTGSPDTIQGGIEGRLVRHGDNSPNNNALGIPVLAIALLISSPATVIRIYARAFVIRKVWLEDIIALVGYTGLRLAYGKGLFVHQWDIRIRELSEVLYALTIGTIFYKLSTVALKVAILLEWIHIFAPERARGAFYRACQFLIIFNIAAHAAALLAENLTCIPFQAIWDKTIEDKCIDRKPVDVSSAVTNLVSHVLLLALPQTVIWRLQLSPRQNIGISLVFGAGILTTLLGIFRLIWTVKYFLSDDATYTLVAVAAWNIAELTFLVLVYCLPDFPKAFRALHATDKDLKLRLFPSRRRAVVVAVPDAKPSSSIALEQSLEWSTRSDDYMIPDTVPYRKIT